MGVPKGLRKVAWQGGRQRMMETSIALAILAIVDLFCRGQFVMNSIEGSQTIPTLV